MATAKIWEYSAQYKLDGNPAVRFGKVMAEHEDEAIEEAEKRLPALATNVAISCTLSGWNR